VAGSRGPVPVALSDIVAARPVTADRRQVLELERISRLGWRAREVGELDGWLLYADLGWTGRANSVLPLRTPRRPLPELLDDAARFYAERQLPLQIQLPLPARGLLDAELAGRCWTVQRPTVVLTAPLKVAGTTGPTPARLEPLPSASWLAAYHYRGGPLPEHAAQLLSRHDQVRFASIADGGQLRAIARGAVDENWLGVAAVEVAATHRRTGLATELMRALSSWAAGLGATRCYLQVEAGNAAALALYDRLGFTEHHRYHYRLAPAAS
jgi:GNAT superfamily N-acetyltransferase